MDATLAATNQVSVVRLWAGRVLGGLPALLLLLDGVMKLFPPQFVVEATTELGYSASAIVPLGAVLTTSVVLYLVPQTSVLGAILLTGYLGGAVDVHVREQHPLWQVFFPAVFGAVLWLGLLLREPRLQAIFPWRR